VNGLWLRAGNDIFFAIGGNFVEKGDRAADLKM